MSPDGLRRAAEKALALARRRAARSRGRTWSSTWAGCCRVPAGSPLNAARLVEELVDRTLRSEFEDVAAWKHPKRYRAPPDLIRADGRSVFQRHGGTRYATAVQLSMEERLVAQAQA